MWERWVSVCIANLINIGKQCTEPLLGPMSPGGGAMRPGVAASHGQKLPGALQRGHGPVLALRGCFQLRILPWCCWRDNSCLVTTGLGLSLSGADHPSEARSPSGAAAMPVLAHAPLMWTPDPQADIPAWRQPILVPTAPPVHPGAVSDPGSPHQDQFPP